MAGRHIGPDDVDGAPTVRPLETELERVAAVEVPQLRGVEAVRSGDLAVQQEVVDGAAAWPLARLRRRRPGPAVPPSLGMRREAEGGDQPLAGSRTAGRPTQAEPTPSMPATASEC